MAFTTGLLYFWLRWFPWRRLALPPAWHHEHTSVASLPLSLHRSCSSSLGLLLLLPPSFLQIAAPASNLRLPLSWSLSRQAHFLCTLLIAASLSSDSASLRLFPSLRASSSFFLLFLPPASQPLSLHSARLSSSFYISNSSSFRTPLQFNSP